VLCTQTYPKRRDINVPVARSKYVSSGFHFGLGLAPLPYLT